MAKGRSNLLNFSIFKSTSVKLRVPESGHVSNDLHREVMLGIKKFMNKKITRVSDKIDLLIQLKKISFSSCIYSSCNKE